MQNTETLHVKIKIVRMYFIFFSLSAVGDIFDAIELCSLLLCVHLNMWVYK